MTRWKSMRDYLMSIEVLKIRSGARALAVAGLAAALTTSTVYAAGGAFADFAGSYRGKGKVTDVNGKSETLTCKSDNAPAPDGIAMQLSLVCASDSYRVDFHADLYTDGQNLHGKWTETTRSAEGEISGTITPTLINAQATAPGFGAQIAVKVQDKHRLDVALNAQGTSINHVEVSMRK